MISSVVDSRCTDTACCVMQCTCHLLLVVDVGLADGHLLVVHCTACAAGVSSQLPPWLLCISMQCVCLRVLQHSAVPSQAGVCQHQLAAPWEHIA
jgi:hypothetical protein